MFIKKNIYKVSERKDLKIAYSAKVKIEDLWVEITNDNGKKHLIRPGFHYMANTTSTTQKQSDFKVEQPSFALIALF